MHREKKGKHVPAASGGGGGGGGIDVLPDDILEHILGFLPAEEAGRTSVLARRWRHRWKFATALNVACIIDFGCYRLQLQECPKAVDDMLRLRGSAPLEACQLTFGCRYEDADVLCPNLNRWVRHVVMCGVQRFRLENIYIGERFRLDDQPLVSRHLTRLELVGIELKNNEYIDFSSCPALQHLDIDQCHLWDTKKLSSQSMKSLSITSCDFSMELNTLLIHVPSLVSLNLDSHLYRPPVLGSMPSLKKAFVRVSIDEDCAEGSEFLDLDCYSCHIMEQEENKSFLLDGLSNAENLTLLSETTMFIFEKGLKRCPTFSNLKTLLLNYQWCVAPHFLALTCILKHSPVLEKLTLKLNSRGPKHRVEIIGVYLPMDGSTTKLEHLKAIEVKCDVIDANVHKALQFLCKFNFCFIFK